MLAQAEGTQCSRREHDPAHLGSNQITYGHHKYANTISLLPPSPSHEQTQILHMAQRPLNAHCRAFQKGKRTRCRSISSLRHFPWFQRLSGCDLQTCSRRSQRPRSSVSRAPRLRSGSSSPYASEYGDPQRICQSSCARAAGLVTRPDRSSGGASHARCGAGPRSGHHASMGRTCTSNTVASARRRKTPCPYPQRCACCLQAGAAPPPRSLPPTTAPHTRQRAGARARWLHCESLRTACTVSLHQCAVARGANF
jgi:hypothetical protein